MSLRDAVIRAGAIAPDIADRADKKRYSEKLSHELAIEVADGLRELGFSLIKPPAEKFEDVTLMPYRPVSDVAKPDECWVRLYRAGSFEELSEEAYLLTLLDSYNQRNPHAMVGEMSDEDEVDFEEMSPEDQES